MTRSSKSPGRMKGGPKMVAHADLPTRYGRFRIYGFLGRSKQEEAIALVRGNLKGKTAPLKKIGAAASGVLLYLPQEGRGIGLMNKLRAYQLQDGGMDTVEANESLGFAADARDYEFSAQILKKLGATRIRLLSNNPEKVRQLQGAGIEVVERVSCQPRVSKISRAYLKTKKRKMGHLLQGL